MKYTCLFFLLYYFGIPKVGFAQNADPTKFTLSGYVEDAATGEKLIGANVYHPASMQGTATNAYGFFSLTLPQGTYEILCSYVGYEPIKITLKLDQDLRQNLVLKVATLETVEVVANESIQELNQMSSHTIAIEKAKKLPSFMGEQDILKVIQLLPGVQSGIEGSSGLYVRGGSADQNLVLLDGVPIYNASHLGGFFSVFNADAINHVQLIKGGFPARYGGRLSSVLDIRMKEGNFKKFHGSGSIGIISSKLQFEGPIKKEQTSFMVSARRTYFDLLTRPIAKAQSGGPAGYYFYDFNVKVNHRFSSKSHLYLSTYLGTDRFFNKTEDEYRGINGQQVTSKENNHLRWGNRIVALRWNYAWTPQLFSNVTATYSRYRYDILSEYTSQDASFQELFRSTFVSGIEDWTLKADFDYVPNPNHYIRFGLGDIYHTFNPGANQIKISSLDENIDTKSGTPESFTHEYYAYVEDDLKISDWLKVNLGLHFTGFWSKEFNYTSLQPRFSARILTGKKGAIKVSYARIAQFLHLLSNPTVGLPADLWVPPTQRLKPEEAHQIALGYTRRLSKNYEISLEGYYKTMDNLIEYLDGSSFFGTDKNWQDKVALGRGWSYGAELLLEKKKGKTTGWIGYTLAWSNRQFPEINFGEVFPFRYDRRHDISIAFNHKFNDRIDIGATWVYGTGNAVTLPTQKIKHFIPQLTNNTISYFDQRNNYRTPSYHRMDLGINFRKKKKWGERVWSVGFYNIYSRQNPFYLYLNTKADGSVALTQISIFPILPYVSYNFKF